MADVKLISRFDKNDSMHLAKANSEVNSIRLQLESWYQKYDLECYCVPNGVLMHIRYRLDSDLYYLADNPTSEKHDDKCELYTSRKQDPLIVDREPLKPVTHFSPYRILSASETRPTKAAKTSKRPLMSTLEKVFCTLSSNAFANYQFGRFVTMPNYFEKISKAEKNKSIVTPWGKSLVELMFYGPKGQVFAHNALNKMAKEEVKQVPATIWFNYAPASTTFTDKTVTVRDKTYTAKKVIVPHKADGPYLMLCTITDEADSELSMVREILLMPIVSKDYILPVHSNEERLAALSFLPSLFGLNNSREYSYYLVKPLWPESTEKATPIWASFLLFRKSKLDNTRQFQVFSDANQSLLSEIYGSEVNSIDNLNKELTW